MCPGDLLLEDISLFVPNKGMALVARDGTTLCSRFDEGVASDTFAIMSATMLGAAQTAGREVGLERIARLSIDGDMGRVLVYPAGKRNLLVLVVDSIAPETEKRLKEALPGLGNV